MQRRCNEWLNHAFNRKKDFGLPFFYAGSSVLTNVVNVKDRG